MSAGRNRQLSFDDRIRQLEKEAAEVRQNIKRISKRKKAAPQSESEWGGEPSVQEVDLQAPPDRRPSVDQVVNVHHPDDLFSLSSPGKANQKPKAHHDNEYEPGDLTDELEEDPPPEPFAEAAGPVSPKPASHERPRNRASNFKMDEKFAGYLASGSFMSMGRREPDPKVIRNKAIFLLIVLGIVAYSVYWLIKVL